MLNKNEMITLLDCVPCWKIVELFIVETICLKVGAQTIA